MKKLIVFSLLILHFSSFVFSQVGINLDGSLPHSSAMLDVKSINKGFLPPRMTRSEMNAIPNPADGLIVYCTDCLPDGKGVLATFMDSNWNILDILCISPLTPSTATNVPSLAGIVWDWKSIPYSTGYKWNTTNDYASATQMDTVTTKTETGLACNTAYTRYVWAYNACGNSLPLTLTQTTLACSIPTLSTTNVSAIAPTTATSGGNITNDGGIAVTARGVCWGTSPNPTTSDSKTTNGTGVGSFASTISRLTENTTYYIRAYATNSSGTGYGNEITYKNLVSISAITFNPDLTYGTMTDIDGNQYKTITIGTQTWMAENLKTTKYRNGDPITNVTENASWAALATGAFCWYNNNAAIYKATYGALYNWFAVADSRNIAPTGWHVPSDAEWTTLTDFLGDESVAGGKLKETGTKHFAVQNTDATNSSGFTALPGSNRSGSGPFNAVGYTGGWWSNTTNGATGAFYRYLDYTSAYFRGYDFNNSKLNGFSVRCIKDPPIVPTLTTIMASSNASTTATSGGNITSDGGSTVTARGVCWGTSPNPTTSNSKTTDGSGPGDFISSLTGLTANTTYYLRAYATNGAGTGYGNELTFKTVVGNATVTDIDGNVYNTVTIGTQTWMVENLKTTKYRNGDPINNVTDGATWGKLATGAYCWYNNDAATYKATYGALYNWYAVADSRNIAPAGWHMPTDAEWTILTDYLGGETIAGGKLKESGTAHWLTPNTEATNSNGFTAFPGGSRHYTDGSFFGVGNYVDLWSITAFDSARGWGRDLNYNTASAAHSYFNKRFGFSVRCIRD